jgi:hypothetical protein
MLGMRADEILGVVVYCKGKKKQYKQARRSQDPPVREECELAHNGEGGRMHHLPTNCETNPGS